MTRSSFWFSLPFRQCVHTNWQCSEKITRKSLVQIASNIYTADRIKSILCLNEGNERERERGWGRWEGNCANALVPLPRKLPLIKQLSHCGLLKALSRPLLDLVVERLMVLSLRLLYKQTLFKAITSRNESEKKNLVILVFSRALPHSHIHTPQCRERYHECVTLTSKTNSIRFSGICRDAKEESRRLHQNCSDVKIRLISLRSDTDIPFLCTFVSSSSPALTSSQMKLEFYLRCVVIMFCHIHS